MKAARPLVDLPEVRERIDPRHTMPEAQALRGLMMQAVTQVIRNIGSVPEIRGVSVYLERYLEGKKIAEIAKELDVRREWVSRSYRKDGFALSASQFMRLISQDS